MSEERLQKILARAGVASRRKVEEMIEAGQVTVNGTVAALGDKADPERDSIKVDGKRVQPASHEHRYLLLNKPKKVMSTLSDPEGRKTVLDFIPPAMRKAIVPVGRLDYNTEGLLLLTDDGEFAQRIAHPRYGSTKTYEVKVKGTPTEAQLDRLRNGVMLEGRRTAPAKITARNLRPITRRGEPESDNSWWVVEIAEGRTRQIREMFFQIGHPVGKLRRVAIGPLRDSRLPVGALRELSEEEVRKLLKSARAPEEKRPARKKAAPAAGSTVERAEKDERPKRPVRPARPAVQPVRAGARKPKPAGTAKRTAAPKLPAKKAPARKAAPRGGKPASRPSSRPGKGRR
jgi:23S rRNA pseudouridine2605 synthase